MPEPQHPSFTQRAADLALLQEAAQAAGKIALSYWRRAPEAWEKAGGAGPVSEADLASNRLLHDRLCAARPDYGWLSEESPDDLQRLSQARLFIVDPIDGTRAFLAGEDGFAVSVAVAHQGCIEAGVVHLPARGLTYAAFRGGGATCNDKILQTSGRRALAGADVLATKPTLAPEMWQGALPDLRRSFRPSLAWRFCLVAEGRHDAMITLRDTFEWDSAAGSLIAEMAGARVSDAQGAPLRFNQPLAKAKGVIVAPPALHEALMAQRH